MANREKYLPLLMKQMKIRIVTFIFCLAYFRKMPFVHEYGVKLSDSSIAEM